jgi:CBS domain-containing protein
MLSGIRRMPVLDDSDHVAGIVSATDVLNFIGGGEKNRLFSNTGLSATVKKIMSPDVKCLIGTDSIPVAIEFFKMHGKPIHPITEDDKLTAVLSESDVVHLITKDTGMKVMHVMSQKPFTVAEDFSVYDVAKMLCRGPYRRLPVVNKGVLTGIVTPFDILSHLNRNEKLNDLKTELTPIKDVMNKHVACVSPDADVHEAVKHMKVRKISGMPAVSEDMDIAGMLTKKDIIQVMN